jgi:hypothetical protein
MVAVFKARFIFCLPARAGGVRLIAMLGGFLAGEAHGVAGLSELHRVGSVTLG